MLLNQRSIKLLFAGATAILLAVAIAACGGSGSSSTSASTESPATSSNGDGAEASSPVLEKLYEEAKTAGDSEVVIYGGGAETLEPAWEVFSEKFPGISVKGVAIRGSDAIAKVTQEAQSGNKVADFSLGTGSIMSTFYDEGLLEPAVPQGVNLSKLPPNAVGVKNSVYAASGAAVVIAYNPNELEESELPKEWTDLTEPQYKGKIVMGDPGQITVAFSGLDFLKGNEVIDEEWLKELNENEPQITAPEAEPNNTQVIASGSRTIIAGYPLNWVVADAAKGAPIAADFPLEGPNVVASQFWGLVKEPPHPAADALLLAWVFSPEGQKAIADAGEYPLLPGSPGPEGFPSFEKFESLPQFPFSTWAENDATNVELFASIFD